MERKTYNNINKYDRYLIILISLQIFGNIGGAIQPVRLFMILFIPLTIYFIIKNKSISKLYIYEGFIFFIWTTLGLFSLIWVINFQEGLKEMLYLTLYFSSFFLIIYFSNKAYKPKESIIKGWCLLFLLTVPIALVEVLLNIHLPSTYHEDMMVINLGGGDFIQRRFASVTYGNLNGYNTILVYVMPFVLGNIVRNHTSSIKKLLAITIFLLLSFLIIVNSSRASIICLFIASIALLSYSIKSPKVLITIIFPIIVSVVLLLHFNQDFLTPIRYRIQNTGFEDSARMNLIKLGFDALIESKLLGIGAGNFSPTMGIVYGQQLTSAHNFFLEVVVQYGLVIFVLFIGMFIRILMKNKNNIIRSFRLIILISLLTYPITSIINSGYILNASTWLFISSLYIIADRRYDNTNYYLSDK